MSKPIEPFLLFTVPTGDGEEVEEEYLCVRFHERSEDRVPSSLSPPGTLGGASAGLGRRVPVRKSEETVVDVVST